MARPAPSRDGLAGGRYGDPVTDGGGSARDGSVQSVDRAISILQVLARRGLSGVTAIAEDLSLHKSTVSRLLATLEARGLVEHIPGRGGYRLDYGVVLLAEGVTKRTDLTVISRPVCAELAEDIGETINIDVPEGNRAVTVDQSTGTFSLSAVNWVGRRDPMHVTSPGKVFLAEMPPSELARFLESEVVAFTEHTITDPLRLREELQRVRDQGYASTVEELELGLAAVAVPIRALDGRVIAALSVSGPTVRLTPDRIPDLAGRLRAGAAQISQRNGYPKVG